MKWPTSAAAFAFAFSTIVFGIAFVVAMAAAEKSSSDLTKANAALVDQAAHEKTLYDALDACLESYEQCREECGR